MKSYKNQQTNSSVKRVTFQILHETKCQNFRLKFVKTAWEIANFFVDPRTEDDVVYHPPCVVYHPPCVVYQRHFLTSFLYKSSRSVQQFKYTGLDVFYHWSVAAGERLGAMLLLPCVRAVIACVCRVWCAAVFKKKKTQSAAKTTVSCIFFAILIPI